jgi:hypothetical protein
MVSSQDISDSVHDPPLARTPDDTVRSFRVQARDMFVCQCAKAKPCVRVRNVARLPPSSPPIQHYYKHKHAIPGKESYEIASVSRASLVAVCLDESGVSCATFTWYDTKHAHCGRVVDFGRYLASSLPLFFFFKKKKNYFTSLGTLT